MKLTSLLLSTLLILASCAKEQPEEQTQTPQIPETPDVQEPVDYGDGSKERPFVIDTPERLEEYMNFYKEAELPADKDAFKFYACMIADVDASEIE